MANQAKSAMSFAWWATVVSQLENHEWDAVKQQVANAAAIGMTDMADLAEELVTVWYQRAENR